MKKNDACTTPRALTCAYQTLVMKRTSMCLELLFYLSSEGNLVGYHAGNDMLSAG
jgi:hypothetical protein